MNNNESSVFKINSGEEFRKLNLEGWEKNNEYWIDSTKTHIDDIEGAFLELFESIIENNNQRPLKVFDFGCGDGWIYEKIAENISDEIQYTGFDYFEGFIDFLKKKYSSDQKSAFYKHDLQKKLPDRFDKEANLIIDAFSFFEMPDMEEGFKNVGNCLKMGGIFMLITIDPIMQLLSVSSDMSQFRSNLKKYEQHGSNLAYRKTMDVRGAKDQRKYHGILYSLSDYLEIAQKNSLEVFEFREVKKLDRKQPQIYQFILFKKKY
jgi:ubiquinone/menaquinone biosynthesis C-methylase UbiE